MSARPPGVEAVAAALLALCVGCASTGKAPEPPEADAEVPAAASAADSPDEPEAAGVDEDLYAADEYDDLYFDEEYAETDDGDPIEGFNRGIFAFNDTLDRFVLEPVATGLDWVVPDFAQRALRNGFDNLRFPIVFFNDLFQGKPAGAGQDLARFVVNSTVGLGGLMDPAAKIGLPQRNEDFGQTLGYHGVPPGPYLMLPFFGPSNVRDTGGLVVDTAFRAIGFFIPLVASVAMQGVDTVNRRSLIREQIQAERKAALDWYAAVRSAYSQYRENLVHDKRQAADEGVLGNTLFGASSDAQSDPP
ncbi:MAG: VacJ family lipoprotein [Myxococcota bacterium]|nr:VacJ family lipoprotein [Myxococcota bacterium]